MTRLVAQLHTPAGKVKHVVGAVGGPLELLLPDHVEIRVGDSGCYLMRNDKEGVCLADTWHLTIAEAKAQAAYEFGVQEADWTAV